VLACSDDITNAEALDLAFAANDIEKSRWCFSTKHTTFLRCMREQAQGGSLVTSVIYQSIERHHGRREKYYDPERQKESGFCMSLWMSSLTQTIMSSGDKQTR
jgi:hypothetical protein